MHDQLLTARQLASLLGVDVRTIQRRIARGTLGMPVIDIADGARSQPRVRASDVDAYLKTREVAR